VDDELPNDEGSPDSAPVSRQRWQWFWACGAIAIWAAASGVLTRGLVDISETDFPLLGAAMIYVFLPPLLLLAVIGSFLTARRFPQATRRVQTQIMLCAAAVSSIVAWSAVWNAGFCLRGSIHPELSNRLASNSLATAAGLLYSALLLRLLRAYGARIGARYAFGIPAAVLIVLGLVAPVVSEQLRARHVQPLVDYIGTHWVRVPAGSSVTVQLLPKRFLRRDPSYKIITVPNEHTDVLEIVTPDGRWEVRARHRVREGWEFPGGSGAGSVLYGGEYVMARIHSEAQALSHLRGFIVDPTPSPARLTVAPKGLSWYVVPSSLAGGKFRVKHSGVIELYLSRPLVVPAR